jgi:hypothetical protein
MFHCDSWMLQGFALTVAKNSDPRAGTRDADKAGMVSGFLAEENEFDGRALFRIGTWGVAAVGAVVLAVAANQSSSGWRRDQLAAVDVARQAQQIQSLTKESQNETRRLASAIDTLNSDRDRLFSRVTVIEQGLDSVTGAIARQGSATTASSVPQKPSPPASAMPAMIAPPPVVASDNAASTGAPLQNQPAVPAITPVTTTVVTGPEKPPAAPAKAEPTQADNASLPQIKPAAPAGNSSVPGMQVAVPLGAGKSMMGPPDPGAPRMIEPAKESNKDPGKTANAAPLAAQQAQQAAPANSPPKDQEKPIVDADASKDAGDTKDEAKDPIKDPAKATIQRTEFAVDLGGANSISGLRALWRGLLKSNSAELGELRPIIVLREGNTGLGMQLRLAAGPLHDAAEAAKICATLTESSRNCETTVFDGQRLAMGAEDAQPSGKQPPAASSGRSSYSKRYPKHSKKEDPPPAAPPPQTSTFSSLFGSGKR